jgi:hypothetical protein
MNLADWCWLGKSLGKLGFLKGFELEDFYGLAQSLTQGQYRRFRVFELGGMRERLFQSFLHQHILFRTL